MDISTFTDRLYSDLTEKGIEPDAASAYIKRLVTYLHPEDVENATDADIEESVKICLESMNNSVSHEATSENTVSGPDVSDADVSAEDADADFINNLLNSTFIS